MISGISAVEMINSIAVLILAALIAWARLKEKKLAEKYKLKPNPERCAVNEGRIKNLEVDVGEIKAGLKEISNSLVGIKERLARLETSKRGGKKN